jgi:hypothetical protein
MAKKSITRWRTRRATSHHRRPGFTLPLAIVAGLSVPAVQMWEARSGGLSAVSRTASKVMTGYDYSTGTFKLSDMSMGLVPVIVGYMVHWLIGGRLGVNRAIARTGIPFIRI